MLVDELKQQSSKKSKLQTNLQVKGQEIQSWRVRVLCDVDRMRETLCVWGDYLPSPPTPLLRRRRRFMGRIPVMRVWRSKSTPPDACLTVGCSLLGGQR
jgi:hypothetical protein